MSLFLGQVYYQLDAKNRIFIPSKHRDSLGPEPIVFPSLRNRHVLIVATEEFLLDYIKKIWALPNRTNEEKINMENYVTKRGGNLSPDSQGRIVLPAELVARAELGGLTVISGCKDHIELMSAKFEKIFDDDMIDSFESMVSDSSLA